MDVERRRLAEELGDLLRERRAEVADRAAGLEPAHQLGGRAHADVAGDQRLLEPLPRALVAGVERRDDDLLRQRAAALRERVAQPAEESAPLFLRRGASSASPSSCAHVLAMSRPV